LRGAPDKGGAKVFAIDLKTAAVALCNCLILLSRSGVKRGKTRLRCRIAIVRLTKTVSCALPFANLAFLLLCCFGTFLAERSSSSLRQMCNSALPSRGFCGLLDVPTSCSSLFGRRHFCYLNYYSFSNLVRNGPGRLVFPILGSETSSTSHVAPSRDTPMLS
jgi:hypothetical protein